MKVLLGLLGLPLLLHAEITQPNDLDWLVGCWETADGSSKEVWIREPDGSLIGFSVTIADVSVQFYEVLRVVVDQDGALTYTAYPNGRSPTTFVRTDSTATSIVFANPEHDYPKEIAYRIEDSNLFATISALNGTDQRSFNKSRCK